jgi:hypothetical protein
MVAGGTWILLLDEKELQIRLLRRGWLELQRYVVKGCVRPYPALIELGSRLGMNMASEAQSPGVIDPPRDPVWNATLLRPRYGS